MAGQFSCFGCLLTLFTEELLTAAKTLVDSYPNDLDSSFVDELCHFAKFADIFKDDEPGNISTELFLYELIIDAGGLMIQCIPWQSPPPHWHFSGYGSSCYHLDGEYNMAQLYV